MIDINDIVLDENSIAKKRFFGHGTFPGHALIDVAEKRLLGASYYADTVVTMMNCELNTLLVAKFNQIRPHGKALIPRDFDNRYAWRYVWDDVDREYKVDARREYRREDIERYQFVVEKMAAFDMLFEGIQLHRRTFQRDMMFQHVIYDWKVQEAQQVRDCADIDPDTVPSIRDYAEIMGLDLDSAANTVLLQHDIFRSRLLESETLRLKYSKQLQATTSADQLMPIIKEFQKECFAYGKV